MKIGNIEAVAYTVPVAVPLAKRQFHMPFVLVTIETTEGLKGTGLCGSMSATPAMVKYINETVGPALKGENPLHSERVWQLLLSKFNNRSQTGFWSSVASGIDIAVWDLKGKHLGLPIATLLGGAHSRVPAYVTFGVSEYDCDQLVEAARTLAGQGHKRLKMVVGGGTHPEVGEREKRFERTRFFLPDIREDARRVQAVREAVGPDVEIMIDANCLFSVAEAQRLCKLVEEFELSWFEEPIFGNDFRGLAQVRSQTRIPISAGQNLGHSWAHRELIVNGAIDISQPNVCHGGGYTECLKVAALARAFNLPIANGGAWPHHNLHLHAGVPNGGYVEFHWLAWKAGDAVFRDPPTTENGWVSVPDAPGLGFEPRPADELKDLRLNA